MAISLMYLAKWYSDIELCSLIIRGTLIKFNYFTILMKKICFIYCYELIYSAISISSNTKNKLLHK
jgi:hypothetical protein